MEIFAHRKNVEKFQKAGNFLNANFETMLASSPRKVLASVSFQLKDNSPSGVLKVWKKITSNTVLKM